MEKNCVFCRILRGDQPAEFLFQGEEVVVFKDINPHAPIHWLIVPRKHIRSINDLREEDRDILAEMVFRARETARSYSIAEKGYKLLFNVERGGGQVVFHLHLHLLAGWG